MKEVENENALARAHLLVAGVVQGVGYRAAVQDQARTLGLAGWVRNLDDGRVEALAEGPRKKIELLVEWCWRGPVFARVTDVLVTWDSVEGNLRGFVVKR
jgi:acylphosphatase